MRYNTRHISLKIEKGWKPGRGGGGGGVSRLAQLGDSGVYDEFSASACFFFFWVVYILEISTKMRTPKKKKKFKNSKKNKTESNRKRTNRVKFDLSAYSTFCFFRAFFLSYTGERQLLLYIRISSVLHFFSLSRCMESHKAKISESFGFRGEKRELVLEKWFIDERGRFFFFFFWFRVWV